MLGDFISRSLMVILGYAYPAFECFKSVEKNRVEIDELRFWCQYWIIIAMLSVCERFGDIFISWMPLYEELKLAFIIYLWYPKTKGTNYIYESVLRPFVSKHETDIDRNLQELRLRAWDLALYYWHNCTELGQSAVFNVFQYLANQSSRLRAGLPPQKDDKNHRRGPPPPPPPSVTVSSSPFRRRHARDDNPMPSPSHRPPQPPPSAPPMPSTFPSLFNKASPPQSNLVQMDPDSAQTEYVHVGELPPDHEEAHSDEARPSPISSPKRENGLLKSARLKLRKSHAQAH